jgi:hypothetical protein
VLEADRLLVALGFCSGSVVGGDEGGGGVEEEEFCFLTAETTAAGLLAASLEKGVLAYKLACFNCPVMAALVMKDRGSSIRAARGKAQEGDVETYNEC